MPQPEPDARGSRGGADAAVPNSPEEGMKSLNAVMTNMSTEVEKFGTDAAAVPNSPEGGMKNLNVIMTDMLAEPRNSAPMPPSPTRRRRE